MMKLIVGFCNFAIVPKNEQWWCDFPPENKAG
jgi:hypothetical protein